jgi:competence protein ComEA
MPELTRSQLVLGALALAVVVALGVRWMQGQAARGGAAGTAGAAGAGAGDVGGAGADPPAVRLEPARRGRALVHVAGAVRRPGVYRLADGARVQDAVRRAGGATSRANTGAINLAARVADGQQVVVPRRVVAPGGGAATGGADGGDAAGGAANDAAGGAAAAPISLSTATVEQLDTLDGVGPATARKILDWRRQHGGFRSVDDLGQVPGIGPKRLAALRERVQP